MEIGKSSYDEKMAMWMADYVSDLSEDTELEHEKFYDRVSLWAIQNDWILGEGVVEYLDPKEFNSGHTVVLNMRAPILSGNPDKPMWIIDFPGRKL